MPGKHRTGEFHFSSVCAWVHRAGLYFAGHEFVRCQVDWKLRVLMPPPRAVSCPSGTGRTCIEAAHRLGL